MPFSNKLHTDQLLSTISVKYKNDNYVAQEVFPAVSVKKDSDLYRIYDRNFRLPTTSRANRGVAREHNFDVSTAQYILEEHALKEYVSDRDAANYDLASLRADTTEELTDKILLRMEKSVADLFTSTSWSQNVSLATAQQFSLDTTTSNPIPIFDTGSCVVLENSGFQPNLGIVPKTTMLAIKNHSSVIERIKYTSIDITETMLAGLLGIEKLVVPKAVIDSAAEGAASSIGAVWGDNAWVGYRAPSPSPLKPSAGYIFKGNRPMVKRWRDEERASEAIEAGMLYSAKVVASLSGYLMKDTLA